MISDTLLQAYFQRIHYRDKAHQDLETLTQLHQLHVAHIPFENINPLFNLPVDLQTEVLWQKLIQQKRGGYCFEQNLLFLHILHKIGFNARGLVGRVILNQPDATITQRTHMVILVKLNGKQYLCDTGFGGQVLPQPIRFIRDIPQKTSHEDYRLIAFEENFILQTYLSGQWHNLYKFDLQKTYLVDYKIANWYTSTHPDSSFTKRLVVTRVGEKCRYILHNNSFSIYHLNDDVEKKRIEKVSELRSLLQEVFGIRLWVTDDQTRILQAILNNP